MSGLAGQLRRGHAGQSRGWLEELGKTQDAQGIMYTTLAEVQAGGEFGELVAK